MSGPNETPNYLPSVVDAAGQVAVKPGLHHVTVLHDDWCRLLKGQGPCNCSPLVRPAVSHELWKRKN